MKSNIYLNIHINQYANKNLKSLVANSIKKSQFWSFINEVIYIPIKKTSGFKI